ncbi:UBE2O [Cordylochernes scorpioides]|uniref:UBE2O n=1 Tax=Cordylochernes scorpioides TaxID=51811 RepID=A0ABY6KBX1_9ARAC|nr:UBE2O [Cordylochernes scorpioides]
MAERKLRLLDRKVNIGDIVSGGEPRQLGLCRATRVSAVLQVLGTNRIIMNVPRTELRPLEKLSVDQRVVYDDWLGVVEDVRGEVAIKSALDDSRGTMEASQAADLLDVLCERNKLSEFRAYAFYPGQQLWAPTKYFKDVKWSEMGQATKEVLKFSGKNLRILVEDFRIISVSIRILGNTKPTFQTTESTPVVIPISVPELEAIGSQYYYVVKSGDVFTTLAEWRGALIDAYDSEIPQQTCDDSSSTSAESFSLSNRICQHCNSQEEEDDKCKTTKTKQIKIKYNIDNYSTPIKSKAVRPPLSFFNQPDLKDSEVVVVELLQTTTMADIVWQDGTSSWCKSTDLTFLEQSDKSEFFPGSYVASPSGHDNYGVVEQVSHGDRTAVVQWFKTHPGVDIRVEPSNKEELSIYDLKEHIYNDIKHGSWVILLKNPENEDPLSKCGQVADLLPSGQLKVTLANKEEAILYPHEVCLESEDFDETTSIEEDDSWETQSDISDKTDPGKVNQEKANDITECITDFLKTMGANLPGETDNQTVMASILERSKPILIKIVDFLNEDGRQKFVLSLTDPNILPNIRHLFTDIFDLFRLNDTVAIKEKLNNFCSEIRTLEYTQKSTPESDSINATTSSSTEETTKIEAVSLSIEDIESKVIILEQAPYNHSYISSVSVSTKPQNFAKRITHEISILKNSLPEGILVRSFTDRLDLFSVLIKGSKGTPYEDGIFVFDLQLPGNYPSHPPHVSYISYCGERLNPNLYVEGRVCVSLLGTWDGKGSEIWNPSKSNLLQVLVSIQGLILGPEPYYNEAGFDKQIGTTRGQENSRMYNEAVLLNLLQSLTNMARNPHQVFVQEIRDHLMECGPRLVSRLEGWLQTSSSEHYAEDVNSEEDDSFTVVKGRKRRRDSPDLPVIAAQSNSAGTSRRQRPSTGRMPQVQEIRTTRAHVMEARARQASCTEEQCCFLEYCPEYQTYQYMKAMEKVVGSTRNIVQFTKVNGQYLVGLANRSLAERLVREGLEIEGTLLKTFPFRRTSIRITIGNLPFFVGDAAVMDALSRYGRITSIAPKQLRVGEFDFTDGRREAFILLHDGITVEMLPARFEIKIKGEPWPAFLTFGIKCSKCRGQGHRRANCPQLNGRPTTSRRASPPPSTSLPPSTAPGLPRRTSAAPPAPALPSPAMEVCSAPPVARAVLHPLAPRPSPPEAPALPLEETPSAPPPVTPAPSLQAPEVPVGPRPAKSQHPEPMPPARPDFVAPRDPLPTQETLGPAAPTPDVEMSIVEETTASSTSSTRNATGDDLVAFIEGNPSVSFARTDALGLGREEVLDLLSSRTRAKKRGPLLPPPQSDALAGLISQILDLKPGMTSNLYKVLGQEDLPPYLEDWIFKNFREVLSSQPDLVALVESEISWTDVINAILHSQSRAPFLARLSPDFKKHYAVFFEAVFERARDCHPRILSGLSELIKALTPKTRRPRGKRST